MYLFYQLKGGEESWKNVQATIKNRKALADKQVAFISALSISTTSPKDFDDTRYAGDLYFDIDSKDLNEAIQVGKTLLDKLKKLEVVDYSIFLSGSKGLHLTVPAKVFSGGKATKDLPYVYGAIATALEVDGLDMAVYSGGKGRLWRQPNVLRENGKYKVQISEAELSVLDKNSYDVLCSSPRELIDSPKTPTPSLPLMAIFSSACVITKAEIAKRGRLSTVNLPELKELKEVPGCVQLLISKDTRKEGCNFNQSAMTLARFVKSAGYDKKEFTNLAKTMAKNTRSTTYNTYKKRLSHILQQCYRAQHIDSFGYSASYMFSAIKEKCDSCILCDGTLDKHFVDERPEQDGGDIDCNVLEHNEKTWIRGGKTDRLIANFTMLPVAESNSERRIDTADGGSMGARTGNTHRISYRHHDQLKSFTTFIHEDDWQSVARFRACISGVDNVTYRGSDTDMQDLRNYVFNKKVDMTTITRLTAVGLGVHKISNDAEATQLVYVEPSFSLTHLGEKNTYEVDQNMKGAPKLFKNTPDFDAQDPELKKMTKAILNINSPEVMVEVLGWFVACHFKPHILAINNQFPLLGMWGRAGSGKSKTAEVMCQLSGQDLGGADTMVACPGSTAWGLAQYCATSTSVPRVFDEFNQAKLSQSKYVSILDTFKLCYGQQAMLKGELNRSGNGAKVGQTVLSGPSCVLSEEFLGKEPALAQRMLINQMKTSAHVAGTETWKWVYENKKLLNVIGKQLTLTAIKTSKKVINNLLAEQLKKCPDGYVIGDRPRFNIAVALLGCELYKEVLKSAGIDITFEVDGIINQYLASISDNMDDLIKTNTCSVIDRTLNIHAQMAAATQRGDSRVGDYSPGVTYIRQGDSLIIDVEGTMSMYKMFCKLTGDADVVNTPAEFHKLVEDEAYFMKMVPCEFLAGGRLVPEMSVKGLRAKGVSVDLFGQ